MVALTSRHGLGGLLPQLVASQIFFINIKYFSHVYVIFLPVAAPLGVLELPVGALPLADPLHGPVLDVELHGLGEGDGALGVVAHLLQHVHGQHRAPGRVIESTDSLNAYRMR